MSKNVRSGWKSNLDPSLLDRVATKNQFESFFLLLVMPTFELQPGRCMVNTLYHATIISLIFRCLKFHMPYFASACSLFFFVHLHTLGLL